MNSSARLTRVTRPEGNYVEYSYDACGNVTQTRAVAKAGSGLADMVTTASYDSSCANPVTCNSPNSTTDARGNDAFSFTGHANLNQAGTPNGLNQLTALGGTSISHDNRGNVAAIPGSESGAGGSAGYTYSAENRLTHGPAGAAFVYDPLGQLYYSYSTALGSTYFQYDGQNLATEYGSSGAVLRRYVHGPGVDEPLVWYEGSGTGTRRWFHADERGSVIAVSVAGQARSRSRWDRSTPRRATHDAPAHPATKGRRRWGSPPPCGALPPGGLDRRQGSH